MPHIPTSPVHQGCDASHSTASYPSRVSSAVYSSTATPPWLVAWLRHQTDGSYWRQGSLAPDYDAIEVPIFNIGGWHDSYVDPAFRMQAHCPAPSHTLIGDWVHSWPHDAYPGPNLDELHEIARFFDRHLDGAGQWACIRNAGST